MKMKNKLILFTLFFSIFYGNLFANDVDSFLKELEEGINVINENNLIKNQPEDRFVNKVKLHGLNKVTGKTFVIEAKIGDVIKFEQLEILFLKCWKSYPEENTENKLLLKIFENKDDKKNLIFYGWFFSSSPSISGLEHSLYDLKLLTCEKDINNSTMEVSSANN